MRNIFKNRNNGWVKLQQGAIFSGAIADGIVGCKSVYGLVITPRCDIVNRKVSTIHYLPLVPFKIWKYEILSKLYQSIRYEDLTKKLMSFCKENNITTSIFDGKFSFTEDDITKAICHVGAYKDILNKYKERCKLGDIEFCKQKVKDWSKGKSKIKELLENKQAHYYLIEDWRTPDQYMVVMLRDVKRLDFSFAEKLQSGLDGKIMEETDFHRNDVFKSDTGDMIYKLQQVVDSPFLEHIMEAFSKNFCRIGIDRIEESVLEKLTDI